MGINCGIREAKAEVAITDQNPQAGRVYSFAGSRRRWDRGAELRRFLLTLTKESLIGLTLAAIRWLYRSWRWLDLITVIGVMTYSVTLTILGVLVIRERHRARTLRRIQSGFQFVQHELGEDAILKD